MSIKSKVELSRQRLEFYYSIFLILLIPAILTFNTYYLTTQIKSDWDIELQRKANLANEVLSAALSGQITETTTVQEVINRITDESGEVRELSVLLPSEGSFKVAASNERSQIGRVIDGVQEQLVWTRSQPVAALTQPLGNDDTERVWKVVTPIKEDDFKKTGLMIMSVSSKVVDDRISASFRQSLVILIASIAAIVLLMANHFRFVGYAVLLKKLEEVDRLKNDFLSVATHELKTPMAVIKGYISMIQEGVSGKVDAKAKKTLQLIFDQTERLNKLVLDLLNVSRIEQGRTVYQSKPIVISEIIQAVITDLASIAKEKGLVVNYQTEEKLPKINADPERIREVFTNLLSNAIKYTEKGEVTISHQLARNRLKTIVKDTGIGMSAKDREKLFSRFYRIRNEKTENISGTGLGLWIIKQYIEKMGGEIEVDSLEGVGSQFTVTFHGVS